MLQDGYTPQAVAAKRNYSQVVTLLAENEKKSRNQLQALHAAAKKDDVHAALALLRGDGRSKKVKAIFELFVLLMHHLCSWLVCTISSHTFCILNKAQ